MLHGELADYYRQYDFLTEIYNKRTFMQTFQKASWDYCE